MKRLKLLLLALVAVLGAYASFLAYLNFESPPAREQMTKASLQEILIALYNYNARFNALPKMDMPSVASALAGGNPSKTEFIDIRPLKVKWGLLTKTFPSIDSKMNLLDAWSHPIALDYDAKRQELTIRSFGKNAKNDNGNGDDISITAKFP